MVGTSRISIILFIALIYFMNSTYNSSNNSINKRNFDILGPTIWGSFYQESVLVNAILNTLYNTCIISNLHEIVNIAEEPRTFINCYYYYSKA